MAQQTPNPTSPQARLGLLAEAARTGRLIWRLLGDRRVATATKLVVPALAGAYLLWPIDLLPDVLPVLGQLDDLALLLLGANLFIQLCPPEIVREHREELRGRPAPPRRTTDEGEVVDAEYRVVE
jgi:uncharacterized membrane protein YkvA (DUF1232 family)